MFRLLLSGFLLSALSVLPGCSESVTDSGTNTADRRELDSASESRQTTVPSPMGGQVPVVASFSILGDWVREVGGDHVRVTTLVGPEADAHTYEPIPQDAAAVSNAKLVFEIGLEFEMWLDGLMESSEGSARRIVVSRSVEPRKTAPSDSHHEFDPHVWHDPRLVIAMIEEIERSLSETDPEHAADYQQRASAYASRLESLHQRISSQIEAIPQQHRHLVTTHDTFGYFADRYGFRVSSVLGAVSSETTDPSASQVAALVDQIRKEKTRAVFTENMINPELTQQVAAEAQVRIVTELYTDALGPAGSSGDTYIRMMESNVSVITEALR